MKEIIKKAISGEEKNKNKKKIENIIFLIIILIATIAITNNIWNEDNIKNNKESENTYSKRNNTSK